MRRSSSCRASTESASLWSGSPRRAMALQMSVSVMELNLARNTVFSLPWAGFMTGSTASRTWGRQLAVSCWTLLHLPSLLGASVSLHGFFPFYLQIYSNTVFLLPSCRLSSSLLSSSISTKTGNDIAMDTQELRVPRSTPLDPFLLILEWGALESEGV